MKIVKYKVLLNEDNKNVLVKENAQLKCYTNVVTVVANKI